MTLHFSEDEFAAPPTHAGAALRSARLDAILLFAPESQYWLAGHDTFGIAMFQCVVLTADGGIALLTRRPDRLQACGYGMGAVFNPVWVDFPMFYEGNSLKMQESQVFILHTNAMDDVAGLAMCLGHSVLVTATGCERLSRHGTKLIAC